MSRPYPPEPVTILPSMAKGLCRRDRRCGPRDAEPPGGPVWSRGPFEAGELAAVGGAVTMEEGSEHAALMALTEEGAVSQGMWLPPGAGKGEETESLLELPEKAEFSPLRHLTPTTVR